MKKKFKRVCPKCNKDLFYKNKKNRNRAEKRGSFCLSCSQKESRKKEEIKIKYDYINKQRKEKYRGENNPFFGKKHSDRTKNHLKTQRAKNNYIYKTLDFADKISKVTSGKNNPMYGRNCYDVWVNKYGEDVARRKQAELNQKRSNNAKGSKNSMFGKTAPKGSGGGWSGWYNGWYFRSLRELSYVINVLEYYNKKWQSAEKDIIIEYIDYNGQKRTYRADFLVENKELIEVKPKKLMESPSNILKKRAAEEYCKNNNLIYKMVDVKILSKEELLELYNNKKIKFIKKWDLIFREKYLKT